MTFSDLKKDLVKKKYWVCCPTCSLEKCARGSSKCEAEKWQNKEEKRYLEGLND